MYLSLDFDAHDAVLTALTINWTEGVCQMSIQHSTGPKKLLVRQLRGMTLSRTFAWGASAAINDLTWQDGNLIVEMQSGDVIRVEGAAPTFIP